MDITIANSGKSPLYCCGVMHPPGKARYREDWFTPGQLDEMRAHPALTVVTAEKPVAASKKPTKKTAAKKPAAK